MWHPCQTSYSMASFADVSLPVPVDQAFTYILPLPMRERAEAGCRVVVPFAGRQLTGVILRLHDDEPSMECKPVVRLMDETPVLDETLIKLGHWIATYYCAPLGEVLRSMTPLTSEVRHTRHYSLTASGRDAARQMLLGEASDEPAVAILRLLDSRSLSATYLKKKFPKADVVLKALVRKGLVEVEDETAKRDPLRANAGASMVPDLISPRRRSNRSKLWPIPSFMPVFRTRSRSAGEANRVTRMTLVRAPSSSNATVWIATPGADPPFHAGELTTWTSV